jgi:hypothetical protein
MGIKMLWSAAIVMSGLAAAALAQTTDSSSTKDDDKPRPSSTSSTEDDSSQSTREESKRSEEARDRSSSDDEAPSERSGRSRGANRSESSERGWRDRSSSNNRFQNRNDRDSSEDTADSDEGQPRWRRDRDRSEESGRFSENRRREERDNTDREHRQLGIVLSSGDNGLTVDTVRSESTASRMGLRVGDEIVTVGGREVTSPSQFARVIRSLMSSNGRLPITVWREGRELTVYWTNDDRFSRDGSTFARNDRRETNDENDDSDDGDPSAFLGVVFDTRYDDAAVVRQVYTNSPAQRAGVRAGDTILSINGDKVSSPDDVTEMVSDMQPGDEIKLQVTHAPPQKLELQLGQRRQPAYAAYRGERRSYQDESEKSDNEERHETEDQSNPDYNDD